MAHYKTASNDECDTNRQDIKNKRKEKINWGMMKSAIFTIVSNNYLHFARTLLKCVAKQHASVDLYCMIVDTDDTYAREYSDEFQMIGMHDVDIPDLNVFTFQYTVLELNTAVKPWVMETLIKKGYDYVIYIDPDICLYRPMIDVISAFESGADIVITPHLLAPMTDDMMPTELDIRRAGTYNFGFCAVKSTQNTLNFIHWWQSKLKHDCIVDFDRGIFVDQSWIDLVPGLFDKVYVLRHPGYNVAYWNLAQRRIEFSEIDQWTSNGEPLVFFHFSGLNPLNPENFSKHQNRYSLASLGAERGLITEYLDNLKENGAEKFSKILYGYNYFANGEKIPDEFRKIFLNSPSLREKMGNNPFRHPEALLWFADDKPGITWAMYSLWLLRPDLHQAFNLNNNEDIYDYWCWFAHEGAAYFSRATMEGHLEIFNQMAAPKAQINRKTAHVDASVAMVQTIFTHMLGRHAGPRGLKYFVPLCRSKLGAWLTVFVVAATPACRANGNTFRRSVETLSRVLRYHPYAAAQVHDVHDTITGRRAPSSAVYSYAGIYPPETDSAENGLWCERSITIPLPEGPHKSLHLVGTCPIALHRQACKVDTIEVELFLADTSICRQLIPASGVVQVSVSIEDRLSLLKSLRVELNSSFVPAEIGLNSDARNLAWKIFQASTDQCDMIDVRRDIQLLPLTTLRSGGGINLVGYLAAELGVGEAARTMAKASHAVDIPYSIVDVGYQSSNQQRDKSAWEFSRNDNFDIDIIYVNADQTPNTLTYLERIGHAKPLARIGYWHWEQPKLPERYLNAFDGLDEIWVPTAFVHEAVASISPIPVFKVPHAVGFSVDASITRSVFGIPENIFAVLVMYDFHSYGDRKNPEAAIAAYRKVALKIKNVSLIIKTINASSYVEDHAKLKQSVADLPNVIFLDDFFTREKIYALESCCDCMISLHRAEGFGLGPAEMMYLGKPVIATGWSGNMEFMNNMNSFPVNYTLQPLAHALGVYEAGIEWAEPDIDHAAYCLTKLLEDSDLAKRIGKQAKYTIETKFNFREIGQQYKQRLALIRARYG